MSSNISSGGTRRPSVGGSTAFLPIKVLTTYTTRWRIEARVMDKSVLTTFNKKKGGGAAGASQGSVFSVVLMDSEGTQINCKFWNEAAEKFHPVLEKGKVYTFGRGRVAVSNKKYAGNVEHDYEILFESPHDAEVQEKAESESSAEIALTRSVIFTSLRAIELSTKKLPFTCNVVGVITKSQPAREISTKSGEKLDVRNITLGDATQYSIDVALWGTHASLDFGVEEFPIISITSLQIRENRGFRSGSTLRTSEVVLNPENSQECKDLKDWFVQNAGTTSFKSLSGGLNAESVAGANVAEATEATLGEVRDAIDKGFISEEGALFKVSSCYLSNMLYRNLRQDNVVSLAYNACSKCSRKLPDTLDNQATCSHCDQTVSTMPRLTTLLILSDHSGSGLPSRAFSDTLQTVLEQSAVKVAQICKEDDKELRQLCEYMAPWKRFSVTLRVKKDMYNGQLRTNISVSALSNVSPAFAASMAMKRILKTLPEAFELPSGNMHNLKRQSSHDNAHDLHPISKKLKIVDENLDPQKNLSAFQ